MASTLGGQRCCKVFGRAFGRALAELCTELRAELLQGFGRTPCFGVRHVRQAIILLSLIRHSASTTLTAATFSSQLEAGLASFEKFGPEVIVLASSDNKQAVRENRQNPQPSKAHKLRY